MWISTVATAVIGLFTVYYYIALESSVLIYNVENNKTKEKPLNEKVCPNLTGTVCVCV